VRIANAETKLTQAKDQMAKPAPAKAQQGGQGGMKVALLKFAKEQAAQALAQAAPEAVKSPHGAPVGILDSVLMKRKARGGGDLPVGFAQVRFCHYRLSEGSVENSKQKLLTGFRKGQINLSCF
jgi:hypothetical protein